MRMNLEQCVVWLSLLGGLVFCLAAAFSLGRAHPLHQRLKASITSHFKKM
jgi:hypothetical protein